MSNPRTITVAFDDVIRLVTEIRQQYVALDRHNERYRNGAAAADTAISELEERAALAEQRAAAVDRVLELHRMSEAGGTCVHCSITWPCPTVRALDPQEADHV